MTSARSPKVSLTRDRVLEVLRAHRSEVAHRYQVEDLALFGSFGRDQATDDSDINILIRFDVSGTARWFFGTRAYLEDFLKRRVYLVTNIALRPEFRPYVEAEAIHV